MASDTFYVLDLRGSTKFLFAHSLLLVVTYSIDRSTVPTR